MMCICGQVPLSCQIACSIKVGQRLGVGNIQGAKAIGWLAIAFNSTCWWFLNE